MIMESIAKALAKATQGFTTHKTWITLMGWRQEYDGEGRPLRADPNHQQYEPIPIEGRTYYLVKKGWYVLVSEEPITRFYDEAKGLFVIDLCPDYIQDQQLKMDLPVFRL